MTGQLVNFGAERFRRIDPSLAARRRFTAAVAATGLSREAIAAALAERLGWPVSTEILANWEQTVTPPADALLVVESLEQLHPTDQSVRLRSHKFVCGFVGAATAEQLAHQLGAELDPDQSTSPHWFTDAPHPTGAATLHLWGFGATIVHVIEDGEWPDLTSFARWRYTSYEADMDWAAALLGTAPAGRYVLSVYWAPELPWTGDALRSALRLICCPASWSATTPSSRAARTRRQT